MGVRFHGHCSAAACFHEWRCKRRPSGSFSSTVRACWNPFLGYTRCSYGNNLRPVHRGVLSPASPSRPGPICVEVRCLYLPLLHFPTGHSRTAAVSPWCESNFPALSSGTYSRRSYPGWRWLHITPLEWSCSTSFSLKSCYHEESIFSAWAPASFCLDEVLSVPSVHPTRQWQRTLACVWQLAVIIQGSKSHHHWWGRKAQLWILRSTG